jgi:hypothetical protein
MNEPDPQGVVSGDMDKRTQQYIDVRDALKRVDDEYALKRKPLLELQEILAGKIRYFMDANHLKNMKTKHGTCYTSVRRTASLQDPDAFMKYVTENGAFELLDRRANSTAVQEFVKQHNTLPPGCNLSSIQTLGVRRQGSTKDE